MSESFLLSDEERNRFALWLERNAESCAGMIEQWEKIGGDMPHVAAVTKKLRTEEVAYRIVAQILRTTESVTIGEG
jgi:hypothetical protein